MTSHAKPTDFGSNCYTNHLCSYLMRNVVLTLFFLLYIEHEDPREKKALGRKLDITITETMIFMMVLLAMFMLAYTLASSLTKRFELLSTFNISNEQKGDNCQL